MLNLVKKILPVITLLLSAVVIEAQPAAAAATEKNKPAKPYRILTAGKQITIKSSKEIKSIMVWSSNGNRILEQKDLSTDTYNFRVTLNEKILFIRIQLSDGKVYSERLGIQ